MKLATRSQQIAWLVGRRYPWTRVPAPSLASSNRSPLTDADRIGARELRAELERLSAPDLTARYAAEQQKYADLQVAAAAAAEAAMFYNRPDAVPDIRHWSRAAYWTLEEATALALGRDPARVNAQSLAPTGTGAGYRSDTSDSSTWRSEQFGRGNSTAPWSQRFTSRGRGACRSS